MRPMPWGMGELPILSNLERHAEQLASSNQPSTIRSALMLSRTGAKFLISGARGAGVKNRGDWRDILLVLREHRHNVRVYVRALKMMKEPTHAQWLART